MKKITLFLIILLLLPVVVQAGSDRELTVIDMVRHQIVEDFYSTSIYDGVYAPYADRVAKDQARTKEIEDVMFKRRIDPEGAYVMPDRPYRPVNIFKSSRGSIVKYWE